MHCPSCGKEVDPQGAFCPHCGASLAAAAPAGGYTTVPPSAIPPSAGYTSVPPQPGYTAPPPFASTSGISDNAAGAIAYITIIPAIVFLVLEPYNKVPFIRFHSFQSIVLFVAALILQVGITMLSIMLHFIPLIGLLFGLVHFVIAIALFIVWIIAIVKASKGEWYKIPLIGDFAERQARGM